MFLWAEACCTATYILNKCPHRVLKDKTPKEAFTRDKLDVSHFRVFGSSFYIHVLEDMRTKLEPSSMKGILDLYSFSKKDSIKWKCGGRRGRTVF
jgi:hypothetical protein